MQRFSKSTFFDTVDPFKKEKNTQQGIRNLSSSHFTRGTWAWILVILLNVAVAEEKPGRWQFSPAAALITAGGRLVLAILERMVINKGGIYLLTDTDSMLIGKMVRQLSAPRVGVVNDPWPVQLQEARVCSA